MPKTLKGPVTLGDVAERFGVSYSRVVHARANNTKWNIPASTKHRRGRGVVFDGALFEQAAREVVGQKIYESHPIVIDRPDGRYLWVYHAAGRCDPATGLSTTRSPLAAGKPAVETLLRWMDVGCPFLVRDTDGALTRIPGWTEKYRLAGSLAGHTRRFIHEAKLNEVLEIRKGKRSLDFSGYVTTKRARQIVGAGHYTFKNFIEKKEACAKLIGRPALNKYQPGPTGACKRKRLWYEQDMHDAAKAIKDEIAKFPGYLYEKEARRRHPKLPTTAFEYYKTKCQFLPGDRPIRWEANVLRPGRDGGKSGSYHRHNVFHPDDLALIEKTFAASGPPVIVRRPDQRIKARRYVQPVPPAPATPTPNAGGQNSAVGPVKDRLLKAVQLLSEHPDFSRNKIAKMVKMNPGQLGRQPLWKQAVKTYSADKSSVRRGHRNAESDQVDGIDDRRPEDPLNL